MAGDKMPTPASALNDPPEELVELVAKALFERPGLTWVGKDLTPEHSTLIAGFRSDARDAIAAVRAWDREQRAKIDDWRTAFAEMRRRELSEMGVDWMVHGCSFARFDADGNMTRIDPKDVFIRPTVDRTAPETHREPSSNPDDYTDPFNMVTRSESGGLTEFKRR